LTDAQDALCGPPPVMVLYEWEDGKLFIRSYTSYLVMVDRPSSWPRDNGSECTPPFGGREPTTAPVV